MKKFNFNMVEIALAMVIISLGISGVLGLFSVGVNAKKESISENNVADAAEYILGVYKGYISAKYENGSNITPDSLGLKELTNSSDNDKALSITNWSVDDDKLFSLSKATSTSQSGTESDSTKTSGLYYKGESTTTVPQVFCYMTVRNTGSSEEPSYVEDCQLQGYVWASKVPVAFTDETGLGSTKDDVNKKVHELDYKYGVRVYLEVSWPVTKPYAERDKKVFVMDVMNPMLEFKAVDSASGAGGA